jgi:hypothetical protein
VAAKWKLSSASPTRCTVGGAKDLMQILEVGGQPIDALLGAVRAMAGFFYPVENLKYTGELAYYRQREWRLIGNMMLNGVAVTGKPVADDVAALVSINPQFFEREVQFPSGTSKRVEQCQLYKNYLGQPLHRVFRRIIAPNQSVDEVRGLLKQRDLNVEVAILEAL